jgi:hypothetical protein
MNTMVPKQHRQIQREIERKYSTYIDHNGCVPIYREGTMSFGGLLSFGVLGING